MSNKELEKLRKRIILEYIITYGSIAFVIILIISDFIKFSNGIYNTNIVLKYFLIITILLIMIYIFPKKNNKKKYKANIKRKYMKKAIEKLKLEKEFGDLIYRTPSKGIDIHLIEETKMISGDIHISNDSISGTYKNIKYIQSDLKIQKEKTIYIPDDDGEITEIQIKIPRFKGTWVILDYDKTSKYDIQIYPRFSKNNIFTSLKKEKVNIENEEFNKHFRVYTELDNLIDIEKVLTPTMIENILKLKYALKGKILICFSNGKLHIGVSNRKDLFEHVSIFKKIDEQKIINKMIKDIKTITTFIDTLF